MVKIAGRCKGFMNFWTHSGARLARFAEICYDRNKNYGNLKMTFWLEVSM